MWNHSRSLTLSKWCVRIFAAMGVGISVGLPWLADLLIQYSGADLKGKYTLLLVTGYSLALPAFACLYELYRLLHNISENEVFIAENISHLRRISWFCIAAGIVCFLSAIYYPSFVVVACMAAFIGLIVRVVKNVLAEAMRIKEENDYTI